MTKLLFWNFLEGGLKPYNKDFNYRFNDTKRLNAAKNIVSKYKPDIFVINEALFCEKFYSQYQDYQKIFNFKYSFNKLYDKSWGNSILSNIPISDSRSELIHSSGGQNRGYLEAKLKIKQKNKKDIYFNVCTYHPHPARRPFMKAKDFDSFLSGQVKIPSILVGDLNAISPNDVFDADKIKKGFLKFKREDLVDEMVNKIIESGKEIFNVLDLLKWKDVFEIFPNKKSYTIPTDLIKIDNNSQMRIDHCFINNNPDIIVNDVKIIKNEDTNIASDHYPILLDFEIRG